MANQNFKVKKGLEVGTALTATSDGLNVTGIITATQFNGDGSGLTGVTAAGSGVVVQEEGSSVGTAATINFIGSNVTAAISGGVASVTVTSGSSDVVSDTTPQLGGNLDLNSKNITGTGSIAITGGLNATGVSTFQESVTFQSHASFGDNDKANFGAGNDIQIYHNGTNSFIDNATGSLYIRGANGNHVRIQSPSGEESIVAAANGSVDLYYDNSKKLETTNTGVTVTGAVSATTFSGAGSGLTDVDADNASNLLVSNQTGNAARVITFAGTSAGGVNAAVFGNANFTYNPSTTELKVGSGVTINSTGILVTGTTQTQQLNVSGISSFTGNINVGHTPSTQGSGSIISANELNLTGPNSSDSNSTYYSNIRLNKVGGGFKYDLEFHSNGYSSGDIGDFIFYKRGTSFGRTERMRLSGQTGQLTVTGGGSFVGVVTATSFSGSGSALTDLTGASAGTYGASTNTPIITVDSNGRITGISTVATSGAGGGGGISNILEDTTPQLGGDLDLNGNDITGTGNITLTSTDAGSSAGPEFKLFRNSASPADADYIGQIKFAGESDTGVERNYAKITGKISDASNGTEDGIIEIAHIKAGSQNISARWKSTELQFLNGTNVSWADTLKATFGDSDDLQIYHTGSHSYIQDAGAGDIVISTGRLRIVNAADNETLAAFTENGSAQLYHNNALRLQTTGTGVNITDDLNVAGISTFQSHVHLGDNDSLYFGADDDLEIKHIGGSFNNIQGSPELRIQSASKIQLKEFGTTEVFANFIADGAVELFHDNSKKFETTSSGATVTGALTATTIVKSGGTSSQFLMADGSVSTTVGISTNSNNIQATWSVTANGASAYRFAGPGNDAADDNPDLYLVRGQRYRFINNSGGSHPFQIRSVVGGSAYSAGVTNNGASSGNIEFNVQHDAPSRLFYQCTAHSGMVGNIYITGGGQWQNQSVAASGTPEVYTDYSVGIGTNNVSRGPLHIHSNSADTYFHVTNGTTGSGTGDGFTMHQSGVESLLVNRESGNMRLYTAGTERLRIDSSGRLLKSGQAALTSTSLSHPVQIAADSDAQNIVCFGRASDDISAIDFYEADKTTNLGEIQYRRDHVNFRHRVGYISFATGGVTERLRINSAGQMILGTATNLGSVPPKLTIVNDTNSSTFSECQLLRLNGPSGVGERGGIGFHYAQSLNYGEKPSSFIGVETVAAGGAQQTDLLFATRPNTNDNEPTERLRITSGGNLNLQVNSTSGKFTMIEGTTSAFSLDSNGANGYFRLIDEYDSAELMRFHGDGALSINTTNLTNYTQTSNTNNTNNAGGAAGNWSWRRDTGAVIQATDADSGWALMYLNKYEWNSGDDNRWISFYLNGQPKDTISWNGSNIIYGNGSDYRIKENIRDFTSGIDKVKQLKVYLYDYIDSDRGNDQIGFIAHELQEIIPEAVSGEKDAMRKEEETGNDVMDVQMVDHGKLTPVLTAALQEALAKIEILEAKVAALEGS